MNPKVRRELLETIIFMVAKVIIDTHVHFRGRKQSHKTTPYQFLLEAQRSGISISIGMPNTLEAIVTFLAAQQYRNLEIAPAEKKLGIERVQPIYFGAMDNNLKEFLKALTLDYVIGAKFYDKGVTTGGVFIESPAAMLDYMRACAEHNRVVACHNDDTETVRKKGYIKEAEIRSVERRLNLALQVPNLKIVMCHVSCQESAELILQAQKDGLRVAIEIAPHYLWFDSRGTHWCPSLDPVFYHCYNNLREPKDREFLISLLLSGNKLVFIGSDSAGHGSWEKLANPKLGGIPSHQHSLPTLVSLAVEYGISKQRIAEVTSFNQADFFDFDVPRELVPRNFVKAVERNALRYNHGVNTNPWLGSEMYFLEEQLMAA